MRGAQHKRCGAMMVGCILGLLALCGTLEAADRVVAEETMSAYTVSQAFRDALARDARVQALKVGRVRPRSD